MKLADADIVHRLLSYPYLIETLNQVYQDLHPDFDHIFGSEPQGGNNQFVTMVGWKRGAGIAVKKVGVFPRNLSVDPPQASVQRLVAVCGKATSRPLLVADDEAMTFRKTATDSKLSARLLARNKCRTLLVVGAGELVPHVIAAHRAARPSPRIALIWNCTYDRAAALAAALAAGPDMHGIDIAATRDLDAAMAQADIVSCVAMARAPLVKGAMLKPGAHLDLIGAYLSNMRETDDTSMSRGRVFVDWRDGIKGLGELVGPVLDEVIGWNDIQADLYQLCQRTHLGPRPEIDITVFKNVCGGHLDRVAVVVTGWAHVLGGSGCSIYIPPFRFGLRSTAGMDLVPLRQGKLRLSRSQPGQPLASPR